MSSNEAPDDGPLVNGVGGAETSDERKKVQSPK